ncbi:MAG: VCBS repeat-containing protein, partial [Myxococcales bacterium]|nr:VCBS repeat-containing protein [Myxococcales bacterium]
EQQSPLPTNTQGWKLTTAGDVDGDGAGDMVWHHPPSGRAVYWKTAGGAFQLQLDLPSTTPRAAIVGVEDFDGDGSPEILWEDRSGVQRLWHMGTEGFTHETTLQ